MASKRASWAAKCGWWARKHRGGPSDAAPLARADGFAGNAHCAARFDLDEENEAAALSDDVDFARRTAPIARQNPPTGQTQPPDGKGFATPAGTPGFAPPVSHGRESWAGAHFCVAAFKASARA